MESAPNGSIENGEAEEMDVDVDSVELSLSQFGLVCSVHCYND